jgi:drug/metabolite transporter (DMT)-like permease
LYFELGAYSDMKTELPLAPSENVAVLAESETAAESLFENITELSALPRRYRALRWAKRRQKLLGVGAILLVAIAYGSTYPVVDQLTHQLPIGMINLAQFGIAALCFLPWLRRCPIAWRGGLELGVLVGLCYGLQALTLMHSSVGEIAFVINADTLFVPILAGLLGGRIGFWLWFASSLAFTGIVVMSHGGTAIGWHDCWALFAALICAIYLIRSEYWAQRVESLTLTATKLVCSSILSLLWVAAFERSWLTPSTFAHLPWLSVVYLGAIATGLVTFLQFWGQQRISAVQASVALSMEPVWALIFAFCFLGQTPVRADLMGGAIIVAATLVSIFAETEGS